MDELSLVLGAVSHPARREILARLAEGPARVTEIAAPFDLSLNAVSKHLKVLEDAGLIGREKIGREHIIRFRGAPLRKVSTWVHGYERYWSERLDEFEGYFKEKRKRS
jgi:DNA-binding transcriptional ArsR family regulator